MKIRVLLVDDSAIMRGLIDKALSKDGAIEIVGAAAHGSMAIELAEELKPDVIILDIEMPKMDGITALPGLLAASPKSKIIMASALTKENAEISITAMENGASDYIAKPSAKFGQDVETFYRELTAKVRVLGGFRARAEAARKEAPIAVEAPKPIALSDVPLPKADIRALAIASSTGGPHALMSVFQQIDGQLKHIPIFITQHMPPSFTPVLAEHLCKSANREVVEAQDGTTVAAGCAYVAPGDYHMVVANEAGKVTIHTNKDEPENFCRPSADPMFRSLSSVYGKHLLALVLTGMGQDGMEGSKTVVQNGGHVIAQDEATCVVYGMPKAVVENHLCQAVLPLPDIGRFLVQNIGGH